MLPRNYRITALNDTGASVDITVTARRWKFGTGGAAEYEAAEATLLTASAVADAALATGTAQDNSADGYIGASLHVATTGTGTANVVTIFLEVSTDGGVTWPTAGDGIPVGYAKAGDSHSLVL
jgi:hypothetical protein